ncbi:MAG: lytic transglycosylase domain-containing protein [Alphaproteobacteria bacterium]
MGVAAALLGTPNAALAGKKSAASASLSRSPDRVYSFVDSTGVLHFTNTKGQGDSRWKELRGAGDNLSVLVFRPESGRKLKIPKSRFDPANPAYGVSFIGPPNPRFRGSLSTAGLRRNGLPPVEVSRLIERAAARHDVEPELVHAVVRAESGYNDQAVSRAGAMGLMQLMPGTADLVGVNDAFEPAQNVEGGTRYLRMMLDRFGNDLSLAIAAYNAGPGAVENYGGVPPYRETRDYLQKVLRFREEFLQNRTLDRVRRLDRPQVRLARNTVSPYGTLGSWGWPAPRR